MSSPALIGFLTTTLLILVAWRWTPALTRSARDKAMDRLLSGRPVEEPKEPGAKGLLAPLVEPVKRYVPASTLEETRRELYWAHRRGKLLSFDAATFTALRVVAAVGTGLYFLAVARSPFNALLFAVGAWWLVGVYLRGQAGGARREFRQALPMAVATLDMLRAGGASLDEAIKVLVREGDDIVSRWMAEVVAAARGEKPTTALVRAAKETGLPALVKVCTVLQDIEERGVGLERLSEAAREMVRDYRRELQKDADTLGTTSIFVIIAFDMIPFIALVAGPWVLTAFRVIGG